MTVQPQDYIQRSFHYRALQKAGAEFSVYQEQAAHAATYSDPSGKHDVPGSISRLAICDMSVSARTGFKGRETIDWLSSSSVKLQNKPNQAFSQDDGSLCAVLSPTEAMLLANFDAQGQVTGTHMVDELNKKCSLQSGVRSYHMPRQDTYFDFLVSGNQSAPMFAKICGVDMRPVFFSQGRIAQTSLARTNAIIIRADIGDTLAYRVLADSASSFYMWQVLLDAGEEFQMSIVGVDDVQSFLSK